MNTINITLCTDKNCIMPAGVLLQSICMNNKDENIIFHVVADESVTKVEQKDLEDIVMKHTGKSIYFHYVDSDGFRKLPSLGTFGTVTQASYYRLALADILPDAVEKVLYMDCDIIVRGSLSSLWKTELTDYALAAVHDPQESDMERYARLGYDSKDGYFNAGVLLINLDYWRSHSSRKLFDDYMQNHRKDILFHDQDVLNAVFHDKWFRLPVKFNLMSGFLWKGQYYHDKRFLPEVEEARKYPVIVHFTGDKPWEYRLYPNPYSSTFYKYQEHTKWKHVKKTDNRSLRLRIINTVSSALRKLGLKRSRTMFLDLQPID